MPGLLDNQLLLLGMGMLQGSAPGPQGQTPGLGAALGGGLQFLLQAEEQRRANALAQAKLEEQRLAREQRERLEAEKLKLGREELSFQRKNAEEELSFQRKNAEAEREAKMAQIRERGRLAIAAARISTAQSSARERTLEEYTSLLAKAGKDPTSLSDKEVAKLGILQKQFDADFDEKTRLSASEVKAELGMELLSLSHLDALGQLGKEQRARKEALENTLKAIGANREDFFETLLRSYSPAPGAPPAGGTPQGAGSLEEFHLLPSE